MLGITRNELGGSEYYAHFGEIGLNVPRVQADHSWPVYRSLSQAISRGLVASAHGIYRGGLGVHLAMVAMGGHLGMQVNLDRVPAASVNHDAALLFSESAGRFIVTIDPSKRQDFEKLFEPTTCACIGAVTASPQFEINGLGQKPIISVAVSALKAAWKKPFGDLI